MSAKIRFLIFASALFLLVALLCRFSLYPYVEAVAASETQTRLTALCAQTITHILSEGGYDYGDFVRLTYTSDGRVASASVNTVTLNLLRYQIATAMLCELRSQEITVKIPISNVFGVILFSALRGGLTVKVQSSDSMQAAFVSHFEECGINQTRHSVVFEFTLDSYFLLPFKYSTIRTACQVSAADTLIIGDVPDSFTDIDRLTDDVSEIDIDDAVDFGNVIY